MSENNHIAWTRDKVDRLSTILHHAIKDGASGDDVIEFEGHEMLVDYARYLCEYLERLLEDE